MNRLAFLSSMLLSLNLLFMGAIDCRAQLSNEPTMKLVYVFDPLCGWCYGFSPVITEFAKAHPELEMEVVCGGMIPSSSAGSINEIAPFIKKAYKDVEKRTGITFGEAYLKNVLEPGESILNSDPAGKLMIVLRNAYPQRSVEIAAAIQKALYFDGVESTDVEGLIKVAGQFGMDADDVRQALASQEIAVQLRRDYDRSASLGVSGFPTVFLVHGEHMEAISRGYLSAERFNLTWEQAASRLSK